MSIVIEAEFVEVGKHQKVVTEVIIMTSKEALDWFRGWKYYETYSILEAKRIRNNLRSYGWYIVKSKGGYSLMEEATIDDVCPDQMSVVRQLWEAIIDKQLNCASTKYFVKARGFHIVWVPSLQKRLIMRSVA